MAWTSACVASKRRERLRVYYEVRGEAERVVVVKAVGVKDRDRVRIGGGELKL